MTKKINLPKLFNKGKAYQTFPPEAANSKKNGFSLIELLIATGLVSILFLAISAMFMTFLVGNSSITFRKRIANEGNQALKTMEHYIRGARSADCSTANQITVEDPEGNVTTFSLAASPLVPTLMMNNSPLTSNGVAVTTPGDLFTCTATGRNTFVGINFELAVRNRGQTLDQISEQFSSQVQLRN
jgi:prepilin-type N-terminal cleavage/methylation domain-containing protein